MKKKTLKGITGQSLEELREKQKADQRERKRRSGTNQKHKTEDEERFKVFRRSRRLVDPGDIDPERPGRFARTVEEALPNVRRWLHALGLAEISSGESLRDVQRRIYDKLRELRKDPLAEGFPLLSLIAGKLDPNWVFDYVEPYTPQEEWPSIPGDDQPIFPPSPAPNAEAKRGFDEQYEKAQRDLKG